MENVLVLDKKGSFVLSDCIWRVEVSTNIDLS